ncbi:putative ribonuclease H-like domain-containing protein [Tanacetum coccineum]|uniref:Ribonuclease H-like domain-containing protein n=1 Tax=Tanacetum coccineum TaxID=301880 RepID=A0ABQ5J3W6_9ASTR
MRTRSQSRRRRQQQVPQTSVEPFDLEKPNNNQEPPNPPVVTMADNRTMAEMLQAPTEGYEDAIVVPAITADNFELKHSLLTLVQNKQFFGHDKEDPHAHIRYFNKITSTMKFPNVPSTSVKLMLFPFSLEGAARIWLEKEPPRSILTWDDLVSKFINQFFPPSKTTNLRNEITRFQQRFDESFYEAWDRFNDLLLGHARSCGFRNCLTRFHSIMPCETRMIQDSFELRAAPAPQAHGVSKADFKSYVNTASTSGSGSLPSNTIANPKGDVKAITTRSGVSYNGPQVPPPISSLPKEMENGKLEGDKGYALADHGASINLMPSSLERAKSPRFDPRPMILELPTDDFYFHTGHRRGCFRESWNTFDLQYHLNRLNRVDVIDIACEEYVQKVLEISKSGNPTSPSDPIIDSRSPSFTPFGGSDFLMEEIDAFLEHDDSIPPGIDGIYDSEGDTVYLEELLSVINSDPNLPPSPSSKDEIVETSGILKSFITEIENLVDKKVKIIRCDNGTEFKNRVMSEFCEKKGIKREFSVARTPQQNGVAERRNRTLIEAARTMLADSKLPTTFWAEAVNTACYVQNRVLVVKPHNKTPYELFRGRTHALSFMRPFGCHVTILNTLDYLGKFDGKSDEGFFVGYSLNSKAFRVYNIRTRKVEENLHIRFLEDKPIIAGDGPKWLFDIDVLTKSMNYVPVVAGTNSNDLVGTKESIGAGHFRKETGSSQDYILMPLWKDGSLFDSSSKNASNNRNEHNF